VTAAGTSDQRGANQAATADSTASSGTSGHSRTAQPNAPDGEKPRRSTMANTS
jgi:hypothetical protein